MIIVKPDFYDSFTCLADRCPDSCCQEWEVDVDTATAGRYLSLPGPLGDSLRQYLYTDGEDYRMRIENRRCPMWRQDGLCRIQAELGHDALCKTCREFPRISHDYDEFVERGLEMSCPEAARLLFTDYRFVERDEQVEDPDLVLLLQTRKAALDFLESRQMPIHEALAVLLLYACQVQGALDGGEMPILSPADDLLEARKYAGSGCIDGFYDFFLGLEILTPRWKALLESRPAHRKLDARLFYLAKYLISRHWLQAYADFDLVCRVKFILIACLLVNALGDDPVQTAQLFSKEIENDDDNLNAILDSVYTCHAFTDSNLLGLLFKE